MSTWFFDSVLINQCDCALKCRIKTIGVWSIEMEECWSRGKVARPVCIVSTLLLTFRHHSYNFSSKPKIEDCIILTLARVCLFRFIYILRSLSFFVYSLTSSSDQKSNDFRQNVSTMLALFVFARGTIATQHIGSDPGVTLVIFSSLSSAISIFLPLLAHSD